MSDFVSHAWSKEPFDIPLGREHDIPPCVTVTCPLNCGWRVRVHEKDVRHNLAGHIQDCLKK